MTYKVEILKKTKRSLVSLHPEIYRRVVATLRSLENEPRPNGSIKLVRRDAYRIRIGAHRIIYEINDQEFQVLILDIGHRSGIYKARD